MLIWLAPSYLGRQKGHEASLELLPSLHRDICILLLFVLYNSLSLVGFVWGPITPLFGILRKKEGPLLQELPA
jgi:hypothetical protein